MLGRMDTDLAMHMLELASLTGYRLFHTGGSCQSPGDRTLRPHSIARLLHAPRERTLRRVAIWNGGLGAELPRRLQRVERKFANRELMAMHNADKLIWAPPPQAGDCP